MEHSFLNILVHPTYKTPLSYTEATNILTDNTHPDTFAVKDNVPILLTHNTNNDVAGSNIDYKTHYQNDAETYDYFAKIEDPIEREEVNRLHQHILSEIPASAQWILDVGCGGGWLAKAMQYAGKDIISMDISDVNPIKTIKDIPFATHYGLVADVFQLPIRENSLDCIIASEIIEHVNNPKQFMEALLYALKPGGKLIITTPYNEILKYSLCIHCNQLTPHNAHIHSFTEKTIMKLLPDSSTKHTTKIFNNKLLVRTRLQLLLNIIPLPLFSVIDNIANKLNKKAYRLMLTITK